MPQDKKTAVTIGALTSQELGICDEAIHGAIAQLHQLQKDLSRLPANLTKSEALLLVTVLGQLPASTQTQVQSLMDQLGAGSVKPDAGTVIHFPPP